jgi:glycosyltransferase involved in cell wall biosynthesis
LSVSVIIPVYNDAGSIEKTISQIHRAFKESAVETYEIILVDDGSTDNTAAVLENAKDTLDVRLFVHDQNRGYGAALKTGIRHSSFDTIAITDADGTYPVKDIPKLYKEMGYYDMVVGARTGKDVNIPLVRRPAKWFLRKLANYLTGVKIPDLNSGLRVFRKKDIMTFFGILPRGFSFTTTITLAMLTNDMQIKYIPIDYLKRKGKSKIKPVRDTLNFIQLILRTILYFNPLKIFVPIALFLFLVSAGIFVYSIVALDRILDTTVAILFASSIQMLSIGMIADIIDKRNKL